MQQIRIGRIKQAQDEENWISSLKIYLVGDVAKLSAAEAKVRILIAPDYGVDQRRLLFFCPKSATEAEDRTELARLGFQNSYSETSFTTTTQVWRVITKESAVPINGSGRISIGVGCTEVCSGMWESV